MAVFEWKAASEARQNDSWTVKKASKWMIQILLQKYAAKECNYSHDLLKWDGKHPSLKKLFIEEADHILPVQLAREICGHRMWELPATGWMEVCLYITFWQAREKAWLIRTTLLSLSLSSNPELKCLSFRTAVLPLLLLMLWSPSIFIRIRERERETNFQQKQLNDTLAAPTLAIRPDPLPFDASHPGHLPCHHSVAGWRRIQMWYRH